MFKNNESKTQGVGMFFLRLFVVGAILASCGGGSSAVVPVKTPVNTSFSLSGVVIDGYMNGATVFIDRNNNGVQDATEPFAVTGATGAFQLTGLKTGDENYPIVADVPATATDSDTGRRVGQHSIMNTPAPGILTQTLVISPITTLIKTVMDSTPNSDRYTAAQSIKTDLALSPASTVDLFTNYMTLETNSADYAKVHRVAQVVARSVARQADLVYQSAVKNNANATFSDAISLITNQVVNQLPVIEKAIPVGTPSVVGLAWDAYTHSIAVANRYTAPINLTDTYTFNPAVNHQIQLTSAARQKAQALVANTSIQAALVLQDAYVQVVAQDAYSLALSMLQAPKVTQAQVSVATQSLTVASANQSTVVVRSAPVITLKGAAVQTVAQGSAFIDAGSTVTDNVDKNLVATVTGKVNTALIGSYILTYKAKDKAGNAAIVMTRTVKVSDQIAPVITLKGAAVQTVAQGSAFIDAGSTVTDNVDKNLIATVTGKVNTTLIGSYILTYRAKDKAGNAAVAVKRTVKVSDQIAPVIMLKGAAVQTVAQGSVFIDAGSTVTDNVDKNLVATVTGKVNTTLIGSYILTYKAKDKAGNQATATATVNVTDQTAPIVTAPASITVAAVDARGTTTSNAKIAAFLAAARGSDNVDITSIVTHNAPFRFSLGVTTVTFRSIDKAGNQGVATATVTVGDQTAPVITLTGANPLTVGQGKVFTDPSSTVTDNVDKNLVVTVTGKVNTAVIGSYILTYKAKDKAGNTAVPVTRTVNVTDQTSPVITLKGAAVQTVAQASVFTDAGSTVTDNVDKGLTAIVTGAVNTALVGSYVLKYTAKDTAGNIAIAVKRTVNVTDQSAPIITLTGSNPLTVAQGATFTDPGSTVADNVDKKLVATVTGTVNTMIVGTYSLTYTVKDKAGNAAFLKVRTVTVLKDNVPPILTLIGKSSITIAVGSNYKDAGATAVDNIDGNVTANIMVSNLVNAALIGTYTLTYTAKDKAGNAAIAVKRTVNVTDQIAPVVTAPKPLLLTTMDTYAIAATDPYITAFLNQATATDNIDPVLTITNNAPMKFPVGVTTVTFTSIDKAGNQGFTTATVTVQGRLFVGLTTRSLLLADITTWEGKSTHKVHRIQHFYDFSAPAYLWNTEVPSMLNAGYQVVLTMEPRVGTNDGVTHLRDIYAGVMDPYIDASINGIKNNILATWPNADIWMRFGHEMNGDWYPWGSDFNQGTTVRHLGNTAQDYINAYRHVVDRFRKAGLGSNVVKWVFSPNVWYKDNFSQFYPGDAYVDMISVSGFNFGNKTTLHPALTWQTFNQIHQLTYNLLTTLYPTKAYFIAGISSAELGGPTGQFGVDKAAWIDDMIAQLSQGYPKLQGVFWFNENKKALGEADWRIDSSTQSLGAIQRMYVKKGLWKP